MANNKNIRKHSEDSDSELDIKNLVINDDAPSGDDSSELEDGPEMDFPEYDSDKDSETETLDGDEIFKYTEENDEELEEFPSSDTELSEQENSDLDEYQPKASAYPMAKLPEIEPKYDSDSSTEETTNTTGNVPMHWYDDYPHIGYDVDGKRVYKPAKGDELDKFLDNMDDPDSWKTVKDNLEQKDIRLTDEELQIIQRITQGKFGEESYDPYPDTVEYFTSRVRQTPLSGKNEPKRRFIPSKSEHKKVMQLVHAIREGKIIGHRPKSAKKEYYDIWENSENNNINSHYIPPPKKALPGNAESYNPPEEYLMTEEEIKEWEKTDVNYRKLDFIPKKYPNLRSVPAYQRNYQETFRRCLDLYLNPRVRKNKMDIDPESLIPKLPDPKELQPFPTKLSIVFNGHKDKVRSFSIDPTGLYMASGSDDFTVKIWEINTGRCLQSIKLSGIIYSVAWNPNPEICLIAVTCEDKALLICPKDVTDEITVVNTENIINMGIESRMSKNKESEWKKCSNEEKLDGILLTLGHNHTVKQVVWHRKGDYFATIAPKDSNNVIMIHQLSKQQTQKPFRKLSGSIQSVLFHPTKPIFLIATQRYVRLYNLQLQKLEKRLISGSQWISSLDVHPQGDNVIVGSYDRRLNWFDLDLSSKPYKTLRFHKEAIRSVSYHKRYPLFASCSDDGSIQVFHGMVYNDLLQNPLIVPVKILRGHQIQDDLGILNVQFHPYQPWILSSGSDGKLCLFT
ncbi:block of proliferation 1 [Neoconidiobolus thromboides FSU 785]|nr:block of proliferation 1 [Neoconidiobolus thromboides FSU 785]